MLHFTITHPPTPSLAHYRLKLLANLILLREGERNMIPYPDLFQPNITLEDQLKVAYRLHNKEIGYAPLLNRVLTNLLPSSQSTP